MDSAAIRAALHECYDMPDGPAKSGKLETLAAVARTQPNRLLEGQVLLELAGSYEWSGESDPTPVTYARLLQIYDGHPEELGALTHSIHWQLKWMTASLIENPSVPLATVYRWLDELESRYRQRGFSIRPVLTLRSRLALIRGDDAAALAAMEAAMAAERDQMADCHACERKRLGSLHSWLGDDKRAVEHWQPVIDGEFTCRTEPHAVLAEAALAQARLGHTAEARHAHLAGYALARRKPELRISVARHIEFCALTGNEARGLELLAEHAAWLTEDFHDVSSRFWFDVGVSVLLRRLAALGLGEVAVGTETVAAALARLGAQIAATGARYDARHGNTVFSARVTWQLEQQPFVPHLPLGAATALPGPVRAPRPPVPDMSPDDRIAHAERLSAAHHPRADRAWRALAADCHPVPDRVAAEVARADAYQLARDRDPGAAAALLACAAEFARLGLPGRALVLRAKAAVFRDDHADADAAAAVDELVAAAERAYAAGDIDTGEYLTVRRARPQLIAHRFAEPDYRTPEHVAAALAAVDAERLRAEQLDALDAVADCLRVAAQIALRADLVEQAKPILEQAISAFLAADRDWDAAMMCGWRGRVALAEQDGRTAEEYARKALTYGADTVDRPESAVAHSILVRSLGTQPDRELDLADAALAAAAAWEGVSEPDRVHHTFDAAFAYCGCERYGEAAELFSMALPHAELCYQPGDIAMARQRYGECLHEIGRHGDAAAEYLRAAALVAADPDNQVAHAHFAWAAAAELATAGAAEQALAAYRRAIELWTELGQVSPRVRCLRSVAWLRHNAGDPAGLDDMRAVLAELRGLPQTDPEVAAETAETERQLDAMLA